MMVAGTAAMAPTASAAERNYEVVVCTDGAYYYSTANVGGYNQNNQYVHTPNFQLNDLGYCGHQPRWWFKPNQSVEINVKNNGTGDWDRYYIKMSNCRAINTSQRACDLPY
ncbi:hypothetical protein ACFVZR_34415 [Streptomyces sp. NPDC058316]|uniref:hypothetical protein n=1 Tax=unclassified Streptomyces TaxID=2593676 RepID=UPI00343ADADD